MNALDVKCPRCLALPGQPCVNTFSLSEVPPHAWRLDVARAQT